MDAAAKNGIDAAKTTSKRIVQRTADATGDLIQNKIADKITSIGKPKEKETKKKKRNLYSTSKKTTNYERLTIILNAIPLSAILLNEILFSLYKNGISKNYKFS